MMEELLEVEVVEMEQEEELVGELVLIEFLLV